MVRRRGEKKKEMKKSMGKTFFVCYITNKIIAQGICEQNCTVEKLCENISAEKLPNFLRPHLSIPFYVCDLSGTVFVKMEKQK